MLILQLMEILLAHLIFIKNLNIILVIISFFSLLLILMTFNLNQHKLYSFSILNFL